MEDDNNVVSEKTKITPRKKSKAQGKMKKAKPAGDGNTGENVVTHDLSSLTTSKFWREEKKHRRKMEARKMGETKDRHTDPFPGDAPIPVAKIKKFTRGRPMKAGGMKTKFHSAKYKMKDQKIQLAAKQAARTELLQTEEAGFLEVTEDTDVGTNEISQHEIAASVDMMSAQKFFELKLDRFGPYRMNYTRNGRNLLIGGGKGHVAAFDWQTKKLMCEMNVMETVQDVQWLHIETMFAVAQRQWTYVYDNQGIELHCLKGIDQALRLEFLPYHFLLVSSTAKGYLSYLDVSVGKKVAGSNTGMGRLDVMCQNPHNAIIHLGHPSGTVTLWSPNKNKPLVKMLCHRGATRSVAVNLTGQYMATSGIDRKLKIWDLRMYRELKSYKVGAGAGVLNFSHRGLLAAGMGNIVEVYKDPVSDDVSQAYISHQLPTTVHDLQFCPYEDVLGVAHVRGFASLLVPGAGEANFDALEANPYQTKKQRQQAEVKMLLEKVQPDIINIDTAALGKLDLPTAEIGLEEQKKTMLHQTEKIEFEPKYRKKGRSKSGKIEKRKQGVQFEHKRRQVKDAAIKTLVEKNTKKDIAESPSAPYDVFHRFK